VDPDSLGSLDSYPDPDSLKMLDPDPDSLNPDPQLWFKADTRIILSNLVYLVYVHFLCREYVRFELLYVEKLKARQSLLEGKKQTEEGADKQREELVEDSEAVDNVLNCSIVKLALEVSMGGREELVEDSEAVDNVLNCSMVKLALEVNGRGRSW
jgi:hypothetical protein